VNRHETTTSRNSAQEKAMKRPTRTAPLAGLTMLGLAMCGATAFASCPGDTQVEMNECAAAEFKRTDAELNRVYSKLTRSPGLVAAERAWITYRDAECAYQRAAVSGGSMASMVDSACRSNLTKERIRLLKEDAANGG
jgi:uncharacterized protein YecT (DUF1311 family)